MKRIIVTGGAGFIGSNFLRHMVLKYPEYKFVNLDSLTYSGNLENLEDIESLQNYSFVKGDITDKELISGLIQEGDIIVNFAAESHVDNSINDPSIFIKTNVLGVQCLLDVARKNKAGLFVQISTDEVYGSLNFEDPSSKEDDKIYTSSPYSASKASAEMLCFAAMKTFNQPIIITRSSNNFGPLQFPEKVVPLFITNLIENKKVPLYGEGKNIRDWIYVQDNCEAIDFVIHHGKLSEAYNIGGENELTNLYLTRQILDRSGKDDSSIEKVQDRLGHDLRYSLDCTKIKNLGWKPRFSFYEALGDTVNWYNRNPSWWKPLKESLGPKYKYLIIGNGYMGNRFKKYFGEEAVLLENKIKNVEEVVKVIKSNGSEIIINCAGKTGKPNVDACEFEPEETFMGNVFTPWLIAEACKKTETKMVQLATGCIYEGNKFFKEDEDPNFVSSLYSRTKLATEKLLGEYDNVLQIRLRIPIDEIPSDRNLIDKLVKYAKSGGKILIAENSITPVPFLIETTKKLIDLNKSGIFNVVAKGSMTHDLVLNTYKEVSGEQLDYEKISSEDLDKLTTARRSNCTLSTDKLESCGIVVPDVTESVRDCVRKYILNKSKETIE